MLPAVLAPTPALAKEPAPRGTCAQFLYAPCARGPALESVATDKAILLMAKEVTIQRTTHLRRAS